MAEQDISKAVCRLKENPKDLATIELLFRRLNGKAARYAGSILHDRQLAEDAVHEAFIKAVGNIRQLNDNGKFEYWFMKIVHNEAVRIIHANDRFVLVDDLEKFDYALAGGGLGKAGSPEAVAESWEAAEVLAAAIDNLNLIHRQVILLCYFYQYSGEEIAKLLDIPHSTVRSRLLRARLALQDIYARYEGAGSEEGKRSPQGGKANGR